MINAPMIIADEMVIKSTERVLVLCHGNINRSALAHVVMEDWCDGLMQIKSAGFVNPGKRAAKKMRDAAMARGYNLEEHRSTLISKELIDWADLVFYMDGGNLKRLTNFLCSWEDIACNAIPLGMYASPEVTRIPDPAFMKRGSVEFEDTVDLIENSAVGFSRFMIGE